MSGPVDLSTCADVARPRRASFAGSATLVGSLVGATPPPSLRLAGVDVLQFSALRTEGERPSPELEASSHPPVGPLWVGTATIVAAGRAAAVAVAGGNSGWAKADGPTAPGLEPGCVVKTGPVQSQDLRAVVVNAGGMHVAAAPPTFPVGSEPEVVPYPVWYKPLLSARVRVPPPPPPPPAAAAAGPPR